MKPATREPWAEDGFTLIEVLIAVMITAVVVSSLFAVYGQTLETSRSVASASGEDQTARLLLGQMADDLDSLHYVPPLDDQAARARPGSGGRTDAEGGGRRGKDDKQAVPSGFFGAEPNGKENSSVLLSFTTASSLDFVGSYPSHRLARVGYTLEKGPGSGEFRVFRTEKPCADLVLPEDEDHPEVLVREEAPPGVALGLAAEGKIELADSVRGLAIVYVDDQGRARPGWDSSEQERLAKEAGKRGVRKDELPKPLPRLVSISLRLAGSSGRERLYERIVLIPAAL